jgi:hypothetical protein
VNRRKVNAVLATIALLGAGTSPWIVHAEETPGAEVTTADPPASADDSATVWDKTRGVSGDAWEASKEGSARAWDKSGMPRRKAVPGPGTRPGRYPAMPGMPLRRAAPGPGTRPVMWSRANRKQRRGQRPMQIRTPRRHPARHPEPGSLHGDGSSCFPGSQ